MTKSPETLAARHQQHVPTITTNNQQPTANNQLDVLANQVTLRDGVLDVQLAWWTAQPLSRNYNISLRLLDAEGMLLSQFDAQPGFGFLPSSGWPVNEWVNDWLTINQPDWPADRAPYALTVQLYEIDTGQIVLVRRLGELDQSLTFQPQMHEMGMSEDLAGETAVFTPNTAPIIQLNDYKRQPAGLTLSWQSLDTTPTDYTRFVHITNPTTGEMLAQIDGYAIGDSYPTSQWLPGEVITDIIRLDWSALPDDVAIWIGWYEILGQEFPRLTAVASDGSPFPDNRVPLAINGNR